MNWQWVVFDGLGVFFCQTMFNQRRFRAPLIKVGDGPCPSGGAASLYVEAIDPL